MICNDGDHVCDRDGRHLYGRSRMIQIVQISGILGNDGDHRDDRDERQ